MNSGPGEPGKHNAKSLGGNSTMTTNNPFKAGTDAAVLWAQGYTAAVDDLRDEHAAALDKVTQDAVKTSSSNPDSLPRRPLHEPGDGCPTELLTAHAEVGTIEYQPDYRTTALAHAVKLAMDASFGQPLPHEIVESAEKFLAFLEGKTEGGDDK